MDFLLLPHMQHNALINSMHASGMLDHRQIQELQSLQDQATSNFSHLTSPAHQLKQLRRSSSSFCVCLPSYKGEATVTAINFKRELVKLEQAGETMCISGFMAFAIPPPGGPLWYAY